MALAITLAPAYKYSEPKVAYVGGLRSEALPRVNEVKTEEFELRMIRLRVSQLVKDAIAEAQEFGDPLPDKRAWDIVNTIVEGAAEHSGPRGFNLPLIGIMPDGRVEITISGGGHRPSGNTLIVSKEGDWAKLLLGDKDPTVEPVVYEFPLR